MAQAKPPLVRDLAALFKASVTHDLSADLKSTPVETVGATHLRKAAGQGAPDVSAGSDHLPSIAQLKVP